MTRLGSLDPALEDRIRDLGAAEARHLATQVVLGSLRGQPPDVQTLLGFSERDLKMGRVTVSEDAVEAMDERYFSADEAGDPTLASHLISAARLLAAMVYLQAKDDQDALCEAAYEALSATPTSARYEM